MKQFISNYIKNVMPHMEGWCSPEKANALVEVVLEREPNVIVEIGVFAGRSLIAMALACQENEKGHVIGIDPWDSDASTQGFSSADPNHQWWKNVVNHDYIMDQCIRFIGDMGVKERVTLCRGTSEHAICGFQASKAVLKSQFIDVLHIDGNHSEGCSTFDVENYVPLVVPGGVVVFDDVNWATTKKAQTLLEESCEFIKFVESEGQKCAFYTKQKDPNNSPDKAKQQPEA